jgi:hypothetical protein
MKEKYINPYEQLRTENGCYFFIFGSIAFFNREKNRLMLADTPDDFRSAYSHSIHYENGKEQEWLRKALNLKLNWESIDGRKCRVRNGTLTIAPIYGTKFHIRIN